MTTKTKVYVVGGTGGGVGATSIALSLAIKVGYAGDQVLFIDDSSSLLTFGQVDALMYVGHPNIEPGEVGSWGPTILYYRPTIRELDEHPISQSMVDHVVHNLDRVVVLDTHRADEWALLLDEYPDLDVEVIRVTSNDYRSLRNTINVKYYDTLVCVERAGAALTSQDVSEIVIGGNESKRFIRVPFDPAVQRAADAGLFGLKVSRLVQDPLPITEEINDGI